MMVIRLGDELRARSMQALVDPDEKTVWFLCDRSSHRHGEVRAAARACLAFTDVEDDLYVSFSGQLNTVDDPEK
jgi:general stress protein 26